MKEIVAFDTTVIPADYNRISLYLNLNVNVNQPIIVILRLHGKKNGSSSVTQFEAKQLSATVF